MKQKKNKLPKSAQNFVNALAITLTPGSARAYQTALGHFHRFLKKRHIPLAQINRAHMIAWFKDLKKRGLQPQSRILRLFFVRAYLTWLYENQELKKKQPYDLIRKSDLPKLPQYLPRPFPPAFDQKLQKRLEKSKNITCRLFLLMRKTGLRSGELRTLEYHCIGQDPDGKIFLKVPLGKLNTERLVPIDPKTHDLIQTLQKKASKNKKWLLETPKGKKTAYLLYSQALKKIGHKINPQECMQTHRLRHSYATEMLSAGMSLTSVMKLLGHRDIRMTLRYTAITQETVKKEYFQALPEIEKKYQVQKKSQHTLGTFDAIDGLKRIAKFLKRIHDKTPQNPRGLRLLLKQLDRLKTNIENFQRALRGPQNPGKLAR